jgi:murein DD-endopeptidase MepM/ murein hydrolase activator NlpD
MKEDNIISQILIPISEDMQIHIHKEKSEFILDIIPIEYKKIERLVRVEINSSPYQDIIKETNNKLLAYEFVNAYKRSINFRKDLRKGDILVIKYIEKIRLGKQLTSPLIEYALVKTRRKNHFIYHYNNKYYNSNGEAIEGFFLKVPVKYRRISDKFTKKRWHPILKRYRAHLGVDYAAPTGTPVKAATNGKITFIGRKGGYGKTITIAHENGYKTLYAHLHRYRKGLKNGSKVSRGQVIGYVGSTGMSTGPHLHFGLYKNNKAINPENAILKVAKNKLVGTQKKEFKKFIEPINKLLLETSKDSSLVCDKLESVDNSCQVEI